jgi:ERCC4-type nuclease
VAAHSQGLLAPCERLARERRDPHLDGFIIVVDTRERYPYRFASRQASVVRQSLPAGDYGIMLDDNLVASVERKSLDNLVKGLVEGSFQYQLADLATLPRAAVVVEDRYSRLFKLDHVSPG